MFSLWQLLLMSMIRAATSIKIVRLCFIAYVLLFSLSVYNFYVFPFLKWMFWVKINDWTNEVSTDELKWNWNILKWKSPFDLKRNFVYLTNTVKCGVNFTDSSNAIIERQCIATYLLF